jgi:tricorn protease
MLFGQFPARYTIASTTQPLKPGEGALNLAEMEVQVDPRAEWKQMYHEVWRIQRDFFYDPSFHGLIWQPLKNDMLHISTPWPRVRI